MARRRRAVERASHRQILLDRVIAVILTVVAASGLMSVLPGQSQLAVSRFACQVGSLGLGSCGTTELAVLDTQLGLPRCPALAALDATVPEVRVTAMTTSDGLPLTVRAARSGDVFVGLGPVPTSTPPAILAGEARASETVLPGVSVPTHAEWFLPGGQGLDELVRSLHDQHQQWTEQRSALSVLSGVLSRDDQPLPPPTILTSRLQLEPGVLPRFDAAPATPRSGVAQTPTRVPAAPRNEVTLEPGQSATSVFNRVTRESAVIAPVTGTVRQTPVTGSVRWTRDATGTITSLVVAVVSPGPLATGELETTEPQTGVAYLTIPVVTAPERALVQSWLSDPDGFTLPLDNLLGLRVADPNDQLISFLTRATSVTILRWSDIGPTEAQQRVTEELTTLRRVEWPGTTMTAARTITPQPTGSRRVMVTDPSCRTT